MSLDFNRYPHLRSELSYIKTTEIRESSGWLEYGSWSFEYQHPYPTSPKYDGSIELERYFDSPLYYVRTSIMVGDNEPEDLPMVALPHTEIPVKDGAVDIHALLTKIVYQEDTTIYS